MKVNTITWDEIEEAAAMLATRQRVYQHHGVWGIPTGGSVVVPFVARHLKIPVVPFMSQASLIVDDMVDSGRTLTRIAKDRDSCPGVSAFVDALFRKPTSPQHIARHAVVKEGWLKFPWEKETGPEDAVVRILEGVGEDPRREGLLETPRRVVAAFRELTKGYQLDEKEILSRTFQEDYDEIVVLREIPYVSLCEHHLLPFSGHASIGYLPAGKVVGLSKLARLVDCYAQRLQMQERMTKQIASAIQQHLGARGVAVVVRGQHSCMACRGVKKTGAEMVTSVMLGVFRDKPEARAEVLGLLRSGG